MPLPRGGSRGTPGALRRGGGSRAPPGGSAGSRRRSGCSAPPSPSKRLSDGSRRAHLPLVGPGRVYPCGAPQGKQKAGGRWHYGSAAGAGGMSGSARHPHAPPWPPHRGAEFQFIRCRFCVAPLRFAEEMPLATRTTPAARPHSQFRECQGRRIWEEPKGAREHPFCAEGWAMWVLGRWPDLPISHPGVPPSWGSRPSRPEPSGRASSWGV